MRNRTYGEVGVDRPATARRAVEGDMRARALARASERVRARPSAWEETWGAFARARASVSAVAVTREADARAGADGGRRARDALDARARLERVRGGGGVHE